jgi:hypothetical protein
VAGVPRSQHKPWKWSHGHWSPCAWLAAISWLGGRFMACAAAAACCCLVQCGCAFRAEMDVCPPCRPSSSGVSDHNNKHWQCGPVKHQAGCRRLCRVHRPHVRRHRGPGHNRHAGLHTDQDSEPGGHWLGAAGCACHSVLSAAGTNC